MHNQLEFTKLKIGSYNRKSSEGEDKQALSIDAQLDEAQRMAEYYKLPPFVATFKESKSAKVEFNRPQFTEMVKLIRAGKIDSILCWKLDRLARNMTEGGQIMDLLSSGVLKAIITHDKVFYPHDNVLAMAVEFGQGKQFLKDLSVNVKRGQRIKASRGTPHGIASLGFLNDRTEEKGNRKWYVDELRYGKIKTLFEMFLTGTYSAGKLHEYAVDVLKLTTVPRKKTGGALIMASRMYEILKDPVYAGFFIYGGERYELDSNLPRMITEDQHHKVKMLLARKNIPKVQEHKTVFSGFLTSNEGNFIGQDVKYQLICDCKKKFAYMSKTHCPVCNAEIASLKSPTYLDYTFYYNVKKKKAKQEYKSLPEKRITEQLINEVVSYLSFSQSLAEWSREYISELKIKEINDVALSNKIADENKAEFEKKKARLRSMLRDEQITDEEYKSDLEVLQARYTPSGEAKKADWYSRMNEIVDISQCIRKVLEEGTIEQKRNILSKLGSNLVWNDKELLINNDSGIEKLIEHIKGIQRVHPEFEPKNYVVDKGSKEKTEPFSSVFSMMLPRQGSNLRPID